MKRQDGDYHPSDSNGSWDYDSEPDLDDYDDINDFDRDWDVWEGEQSEKHS